MGGRRGRVVTPNLVDQALDWYNLIRAKQQCRQHRTLLGTAERQTFAVEPHLERPKDEELDDALAVRHISSKALSWRAEKAGRAGCERPARRFEWAVGVLPARARRSGEL